MSGKLLDAQQVADRLNVPKSWVYAATRRGELPCVPLGRYKRYRAQAIEDWIEAHETRNGTATQSTLGSQNNKRGGTAATARPTEPRR